jgi:hypothetical protein
MRQFISILVVVALMSHYTLADMGPKPTSDIHVTDSGNLISEIFYAKMLTCVAKDKDLNIREIQPQLNLSIYDQSKDCYWRPSWLAWGDKCTDSNCRFTYHPPYTFRLAVYIPSQDKVYISETVFKKNFYSTFEARLTGDDSIDMKETTAFMNSDIARNFKYFFLALFLTIVLESVIAWERVRKQKNPKRIISCVIIANMISLPIVWFVFPLLVFAPIAVILGEIFAFAFEGIFIHYTNKDYPLAKSMLLSLIMNAVSLFIGGMIFIVIGTFIMFF